MEIQYLPVAQFWAPFFQQLYQNRARIAPVDTNAVCNVVSHGVAGIVAGLAAFPTNVVNGTEQANPQIIIDVIHLCLDTNQAALCSNIALNMRNAARSGGHHPQFQPWTYYIGLAHSLESSFDARPEHAAYAENLRSFYEDTVVFVLSPISWFQDGSLVFPCPLIRPILGTLMTAAKRVGGATFLKEL